MLDFPNTPSEGDVHTEHGQSWQFINGAWLVFDGLYPPVGSTVTTLWTGDTQTDVTLSDSYMNYDLVMFEARENTGRYHMNQMHPARFAQMDGTSNNVWSVRAADATTSRSYEIYPEGETTIKMNSRSGMNMTGFYGVRFIGKETPSYSEYHDPTGVASWRILGTSLECWGKREPDTGWGTFTFPKTFARPPIITLSNEHSSSAMRVSVVQSSSVTETGFVGAVFDTSTNGTSAFRLYWHAVGEWDGIS